MCEPLKEGNRAKAGSNPERIEKRRAGAKEWELEIFGCVGCGCRASGSPSLPRY
jgi:hypothetical protein